MITPIVAILNTKKPPIDKDNIKDKLILFSFFAGSSKEIFISCSVEIISCSISPVSNTISKGYSPSNASKLKH